MGEWIFDSYETSVYEDDSNEEFELAAKFEKEPALKLFRLLGKEEFEKLQSSKDLKNETDWKVLGNWSDSVGFCFFPCLDWSKEHMLNEVQTFLFRELDTKRAAKKNYFAVVVFETTLAHVKKSSGTYYHRDYVKPEYCSKTYEGIKPLSYCLVRADLAHYIELDWESVWFKWDDPTWTSHDPGRLTIEESTS